MPQNISGGFPVALLHVNIRSKILALQTAAQEELLAIMEQIQAEQGEGDSSQG